MGGGCDGGDGDGAVGAGCHGGDGGVVGPDERSIGCRVRRFIMFGLGPFSSAPLSQRLVVSVTANRIVSIHTLT